MKKILLAAVLAFSGTAMANCDSGYKQTSTEFAVIKCEKRKPASCGNVNGDRTRQKCSCGFGWAKIAGTNECSLSYLMKRIGYGASNKYNWKFFRVGTVVPCNNRTFGDPIFGTKKACIQGKAKTKLADEGGSFKVR